MDHKELEFDFKGDRDYVQGPDIFNALVGAHPPTHITNVHFTIHGFIRTARCQLYQAALPELLREAAGVKARASFNLDGIAQWNALTESPVTSPVRRRAYAEDQVVSLCEIRDHTISLTGESPLTFIETAVAMNKYMHQKTFGDAVGKWIFTGIDLTRGCDSRRRLSLVIGGSVNYRLTRTEVFDNGQPVGSLFFSLAKQ